MRIWLKVELTNSLMSNLTHCLEEVVPPQIREGLLRTQLLDTIQYLLSRQVGIMFIPTLLEGMISLCYQDARQHSYLVIILVELKGSFPSFLNCPVSELTTPIWIGS